LLNFGCAEVSLRRSLSCGQAVSPLLYQLSYLALPTAPKTRILSPAATLARCSTSAAPKLASDAACPAAKLSVLCSTN
jgi:hypothetical protein